MSPSKTKRTKVDLSLPKAAPLQPQQQQSQSQQEDCVFYRIYIDPSKLSHAQQLQKATTPPDLPTLHALISSYALQQTQGHIWHKEKFGLSLSEAGNGGVESPFLHGKTKFGDCISDEWIIVHMIKEITREFHKFGLVASIWDTDGSFLLIESADHLPHWLSPSTSTNRVFVYNGSLHIIPPPQTLAQQSFLPSVSTTIPLERALHIVKAHSGITVASEEIQESAFQRSRESFERMGVDGYHYARCVVPRGVARLVKGDEGLVSVGVEAFYERDPVQLKACQGMKYFHPSTNVTTTIRFTRTLYAQLASQEFRGGAPPVYTHVLAAAGKKESKEYKAVDLGMKLAIGFEIIAAKVGLGDLKDDGMHVKRSVDTYFFETDPEWRTFHSRLTKLGYFKNELPGSKLYKTLEREAKTQHLNRLFPVTNASAEDDLDEDDLEDGSAPHQEHPSTRIRRALLAVPENTMDSEFLDTRQEDDDGWMVIDPDALEEMLKAVSGGHSGLKEEDLSTDDELEEEDDEVDEEEQAERKAMGKNVKNLNEVVKRFGDFVDKKSTVDGVLFPGETETFEEEANPNDDDFLEAGDSDNEEDSDEDEELFPRFDPNAMDQDDDDSGDDKPLEIDEDKFMASMIKLLGIDDTILRNPSNNATSATTATASTGLAKKQKHSAPKTAPTSFDPSSLLLRPSTANSKLPIVTLDDSDDDIQDLTGHKGFGIVGNRRGVQESEDDSDDEKAVASKWDRVFLKGLEKVEWEMEESRMRIEASSSSANSAATDSKKDQGNNGMDQDSDSDADDDEMDMKLDEYMAAMDMELSKSKIGRNPNQQGGKKTGLFEDADTDVHEASLRQHDGENEQRPKWRLKRMEENGIRLDDSDDESDPERDDEDVGELDVDANLVKNLLESFQAQNGLPGPASNILGRLGLQLPRNDKV
ncbi:UNVERIFIED_CONTAM: hypothetical protein HDU68_011112 [Siphonaria sp. JEL0065]|nr:hypothetical protein HDU68_011112 [Siphonaria sp. JEL0065]